MRLDYIILTATGERLNKSDAVEFNPNEYAWKDGSVGFYFSEDDPNESYCYTPDLENDSEPITAITLGFKAYDVAGNVICEDEGGLGMWL